MESHPPFNSFLRYISIAPVSGKHGRKHRRTRKGRSATLQQLEARELLTASMELYDGMTQLSSWGSDSFAAASIGDTATKTFTVNDVGDTDLNIASIELPTGFSLQTTLPLDVPAGSSGTFTLSMDTSTATSYDGQMEIDSNDPNTPFMLDLSGTVNPPPPVITVYDGPAPVPNDPSGMNPPDDFGGTPLGTPLDKTFDITNSGTSTISIAGNSLSLPSGFSLVGTFPTSVSAGGSAPFTVQFNSSTAGQASGELSFSDGDPAGSLYQFGITATATVPSIQLSDNGDSLTNGSSTDDFGTTDQGTPVDHVLTISNSGEAPLLLTPNSLTLPAGYSLQGTLPTSVVAGGSANFPIQLDAAAAGTFTGTMSFLDNDLSNDPFSITLTGVVNAPTGKISVSDAGTAVIDGQSQIDFGTTDAGTPATQTFVIQNTGVVPLTLDPQTLLLPAGFDAPQMFDSTVAPGSSTTLMLALDSSQGGSFGGLASFDTSDRDHPTFSFFVSGYVNPPEPALEVLEGATVLANGDYDDFGSTNLGSAESQTLTIENTGNAELDLDTHTISVPAGFSVVTPFAPTVAPGGSTTLVIELDGSAGGDFSGVLDFSTNDPNNTDFSLNLSGTVLAPAITVLDPNGSTLANNTGSVDFGSTPLGTPVTETLTVENTGAENLSLDPKSLVLPTGYSVASIFASSLTPGSSTTLSLQLDATATGTAAGLVEFNDGDPNNSPFTFQVTGVVTAPTIEVLNGGTALASGASDVFGSTTVGAPIQQTLTIENTGQATLTLDPTSIVVPNGFSVVTPFASTVAPGGSTTLVVQINAASGGFSNGVMTFDDNDPLTPVFKLNLSGEVLAPLLQVVDGSNVLANGASLALGTTTVGNPLKATLMIGDIGMGTLTLDPSSLVVPSGFSVVQTFASSVAPATGTKLVIELTAAAPGNYSGTLSFTSNDGTQSPFQLTLSGAVDSPAISLLDGATEIADGGSDCRLFQIDYTLAA